MEKVVIALNKYDGYADCLSDTQKFLVYDIVDGEIAQLALAGFYGETIEDKIKFLKQNKVRALFIEDINDKEFVKIPSMGLHIITAFDKRTLYTELINNYIKNNYEEIEYDSIEEYKALERPYIIPPMSNEYMQQTLPLEVGEELVDLHINNNGNSEGGFKEQ